MSAAFSPLHRPVRRMTARDRDEAERAATPLELLFDLVFVVAVSQAAGRLGNALEEGDPGHGVIGFLMVFFAVWWAWMNFTWFASAYDVDDVPYRVLTFVQMAGSLVLAAGVPRAFDQDDWLLVVAGFVLMRAALTAQWLRAARNESGPARTTTRRYAAGLVICQVGWLGMLVLPEVARPWWFLLMAVAELLVPIAAERSRPTTWHPRHIAERYGLFTLIVLGESVRAATVAVQAALETHQDQRELLLVAAGGLLIVFAAWWVYFAIPSHEQLTTGRRAFTWGYGHYAVLGSVAAAGAGLELAVASGTHHTDISHLTVGAAVTVPVAVFLIAVWLLHSGHPRLAGRTRPVLPTAALLVLGCAAAGSWSVPLVGVVMVGAVVASFLAARRSRRRAS